MEKTGRAWQELNYRAVAQAIVAAGFTGCLAHEYTPMKERACRRPNRRWGATPLVQSAKENNNA